MPKKVSLRLTDAAVKRSKKPGLVADGNGLYLQTSNTGSKSWLFRYRFAGKDRAHGLGAIDTVPLQAARDEAVRCKRLLREAIDPIEERRRRIGALVASKVASQTFQQVAEKFIDTNEASWTNGKHAAQWRTTLATYCFPKIGAVPVGGIATAHVLECIEPIWKAKPETASRLRGRIEQVLDFAKVRELRNGENPARWKSHLDQVLPAREKIAPRVHHEALPYQEVPAFYAQLMEQDGIASLALRYLILTLARTNEIILAPWPEIDFPRGIWLVPPERMKAGREWRVPLARESLAILLALDRKTPYVFPGRKRGEPLSNMAMLQLMRRLDVSAVPHGFRSSFRDWCAETQSVPHEVSEMALAHAVGSKVELAYRRSDMVERRRELAQRWAKFCTSAIAQQATA